MTEFAYACVGFVIGTIWATVVGAMVAAKWNTTGHGYQPDGRPLDVSNPPKGRSGVYTTPDGDPVSGIFTIKEVE